MTVDNFNTRKSVLPPESAQGQGQICTVDLLIGNSTSLPDETSGLVIRENHSSEMPFINPASQPGKIELHSKPALPTPPIIAWRKLMLEQ
ncbi:hypothetical protein HBO10_29260 [Pseudomonas sp. WS 5503]|uniref:hypothetical protein n=1 Tax=Pseudomonas TaxID=286 RepID=UPI001475F38A|nr:MULTISPECIES: hypothetical protein [Pseudomonas]MBM3107284.1 hypothetical protein [Pseudomonas arcuscaelestis]NMX83599.1 hypothetical protein [Pseudomonas sp. WS 5503]